MTNSAEAHRINMCYNTYVKSVDHRTRCFRAILLMLLFAVLSTSCTLPYFVEQAQGQGRMLLQSRPLREVIVSEQDHERQQAWALAWAAREFARKDLHLNVTTQYRRAIALDRSAVAYVVSGAESFKLKAYRWWFPLLGHVPYKGFFKRDDAEKEAARIKSLGYDVKIRAVASYSLLGYLPDPLVSPMIEADPERIVEVVIHELAHATIYVPGHSRFNEGLATFIGRQGRQDFIRSQLKQERRTAALVQAQRRDADALRYREAVSDLAQELRIYYQQKHVTAAGKKAIFRRHQRHYQQQAMHFYTTTYRSARLPRDNAELMVQQIYDLDAQLYARTFAAANENWPKFLQILKHAAKAQNPNLALAHFVGETLAQRNGSLRTDNEKF